MIVYAAMHSLPRITSHPGILIVSRLIDDTDGIAKQINELSRSYNNVSIPDQAISYHSGKKGTVRMEDLADYPVLVITHEAYKIALDVLNRNARIEDTWECFYRFQDRQRKLVVIDEAIDLVDYAEIQHEHLKSLLFFSESLEAQFPSERAWIKALANNFEELKQASGQHKEMVLMDQPLTEFFKSETILQKFKDAGCEQAEFSPLDFTGFKQALRGVSFDSMLFKTDAMENRRLHQKCMDITSDVDSLFKSFIFYSKNETIPTFNTARLLVPPNVKGAVIFDATAGNNLLYDLFDKSQRIQPPMGTRSYANATLHFSYGHKLGKRDMKKNAHKLSSSLVSCLDEQFGDDESRRKVLVITHKAVEPHLIQLIPSNFDMSVAHWWAIDGSNQWQEYDTVVIFGLPYMPQRWSTSVFMALQGVQDSLWFHDPSLRSFKEHTDIRKAMNTGKMLSSIIQGINRVRCRRVIDDEGNCPKTDIFMLPPDASDSQEILEGIKDAMPDIALNEWFYSHQKRGKNGRPTNKGNYDESLIAFLDGLNTGDRIAATTVKKTLGIKGSTWDRLVERLKVSVSDDPLCLRLLESKVIYQGGKGKTAFFIKIV
jgi:hypothetical protein